VGGVSERAGAKAGGSNPSAYDKVPSRVVAVKGIPVFWKAALFAGRRRNEGLGLVRSPQRVSSRGGKRADDSGCPEDAEEGNAVGMRDLCACTRRRHERSSHAPGDASFARSSDPCTSILTTLRGASFGGEAETEASRLGKLAQARGTSTGAYATGRSAARRAPPLPQGRQRDASKKRKEIEVSVPARI